MERHTTISLSWLIENGPCNGGSTWFMSVVAQKSANHTRTTLYLRGKRNTPFSEDYNVTVNRDDMCYDGRKRISVTLTIVLSDIVLQNVDFVHCIMNNGGENRTVESGRVYFNETDPVTTGTTTMDSTPCTQSTTSTSSQPAVSTPTDQPVMDTAETNISCSAIGARPYLLLLCIIQCILICNFLSLTTILQ